ncbi:MAG: hypothetical protein AAF705_08130, partial [Bacteroidota bacterium]
MKKLIIIFLCCFGLLSILQAQNNPGFSYQAVARDANGMIMANQQLSLRLAIIQDNTGAGNGTILYRETHQPTTNEYGLFTLIVSKGTISFGDFQQLDWTKMNLFLQVDIDLNLNQTYTFMGKTRIMPVPVALHAMSADDVDDADADPTNELQFLQYDSLTNTLQLTGANSIQLPMSRAGADGDADPQNEIQVLSKNGVNVTLSEGGGTISVADNDNNPNNELQSLSRVGNQISLSNGGGSFIDETQDADADATNEIQVIGFDASTGVLSLSNGGGQVDLSALRSTSNGNGTDDQQLTLNGTVLSIENGNSIDLSNLPKNDGDSDAQNELQQLTFDTATYILRLTDGGQVDLSALKSFGSGGTTQNLNLNGTSLGITGGNTVDLSNLPDQVDDADADPMNEIQALSFDATTNILTLSNGGTVDLTSLKSSGGNNVLQNLSLNGASLSISGGNQIDLSNLPDQVDDADADPMNEIQALGFDATTNILTLSNGGTVDLSVLSDGVNDADADPMNEIQALSFDVTTNILTLSNGGTVDLTSLKSSGGNNVLQNLSLNGTSLSISGGNQIDLSNLPDQVDDADADPMNEIQALSFDAATNILTLSNGGTVDLSVLSDGVNDADADPQNELQQLSLNGNSLIISGGNQVDLSGLPDQVDDADADPQNELQQLSLNGMMLSIDQGNSIDLNVLDKDDADADPTNELQDLTFNSTTNVLTLSTNGSSVDLSSLAGTGQGSTTQTLTLNGKLLAISDGNSVDLDSLSSPWVRNSGFIEYGPGDVKVSNLYAEKGDSLTQLLPDGLTVVDTEKFAKLGTNELLFESIEGAGTYAYYTRDSLSFGRNVTTLLPAFSEMDALGAEFYNFQARTYHEAGTSEYNFGQDSLDVTAFGLVSRGLSGNTPYERFRLEANNFTMYN